MRKSLLASSIAIVVCVLSGCASTRLDYSPFAVQYDKFENKTLISLEPYTIKQVGSGLINIYSVFYTDKNRKLRPSRIFVRFECDGFSEISKDLKLSIFAGGRTYIRSADDFKAYTETEADLDRKAAQGIAVGNSLSALLGNRVSGISTMANYDINRKMNNQAMTVGWFWFSFTPTDFYNMTHYDDLDFRLGNIDLAINYIDRDKLRKYSEQIPTGGNP
jgi:hypothetical protein